MIAIIDSGINNLLSIHNALLSLGADARVCSTPQALEGAERLVLPGVGAFKDCIGSLRARGFEPVLQELVNGHTMPIIGICLGMQIMARVSYENGTHEGLGWIDAEVVRLAADQPALRVPQIGWNDVSYRADSPLFRGLPQNFDAYFVHSYWMQCTDSEDVDAWCDYGGKVTASVRRRNIVATQFHPEKSQDFGLKVLENFLAWNP
jgi:glutamine amidotransferase